MKDFDKKELKKLYKPPKNSSGEDNGQVTIIGGSKLFHGAPILSLSVASRIVDMVFFATPEKPVGYIAEQIKSKLLSFIWVPWEEVEYYVKKSDAVLIGPGFMSFRGEKDHSVVRQTKEITKKLLKTFPSKKWVIDAGSLQVLDPEWIPREAILTPNIKEYHHLFGKDVPDSVAKKYNCTIVLKGPKTYVTDGKNPVWVKGGNAGLTKGGTGDTQAGLTVALLAKNSSFLAAAAAAYLTKAAGDKLYEKVSTGYNADDLAKNLPEIIKSHI